MSYADDDRRGNGRDEGRVVDDGRWEGSDDVRQRDDHRRSPDDREKDRNYDRERVRDYDREKERDYDREKDRDYDRDHDRDYNRDRDRDRGRERSPERNRDRDRDRGGDVGGEEDEEMPVFVGNFAYGTTSRELEKLCERVGPIRRLDMKLGFAFVFMKYKEDGDELVKRYDGEAFGSRRRRLRVEWARGNGKVKQREKARQRVSRSQPSDTLFVVNFDPSETKERDLEDLFLEFGRILRVEIRGTFAFVQFESIEDATRALEQCHNTDYRGKVLIVEYTTNRRLEGGGDDRKRRSSPVRDRSPGYARDRRDSLDRDASPRRPVRRRQYDDYEDRSSRDRHRSPEPYRSPYR